MPQHMRRDRDLCAGGEMRIRLRRDALQDQKALRATQPLAAPCRKERPLPCSGVSDNRLDAKLHEDQEVDTTSGTLPAHG